MTMATTTKAIKSATTAPIKQVAAKRLLWVLNFSSAMCNASTVGGCGRLDTFTHTDWDSSVRIPACIVKLFGLSSNDRKEYDRLGTKCRNIRLSWLDLFRLSWAQVATILLSHAQTLHPRTVSDGTESRVFLLHGIKKVCGVANFWMCVKYVVPHRVGKLWNEWITHEIGPKATVRSVVKILSKYK